MTPSTVERLAAGYVAAAGIAAVGVPLDGVIRPTVFFTVPLRPPPTWALRCCGRPADAAAICSAIGEVPRRCDRATAERWIDDAAARRGIVVTGHAAVVARAMEAVAAVEHTFETMRANGGLRLLNRQYKAARRAGTAPGSYAEFIIARKMAALETLAEAIRRPA